MSLLKKSQADRQGGAARQTDRQGIPFGSSKGGFDRQAPTRLGHGQRRPSLRQSSRRRKKGVAAEGENRAEEEEEEERSKVPWLFPSLLFVSPKGRASVCVSCRLSFLSCLLPLRVSPSLSLSPSPGPRNRRQGRPGGLTEGRSPGGKSSWVCVRCGAVIAIARHVIMSHVCGRFSFSPPSVRPSFSLSLPTARAGLGPSVRGGGGFWRVGRCGGDGSLRSASRPAVPLVCTTAKPPLQAFFAPCPLSGLSCSVPPTAHKNAIPAWRGLVWESFAYRLAHKKKKRRRLVNQSPSPSIILLLHSALPSLPPQQHTPTRALSRRACILRRSSR